MYLETIVSQRCVHNRLVLNSKNTNLIWNPERNLQRPVSCKFLWKVALTEAEPDFEEVICPCSKNTSIFSVCRKCALYEGFRKLVHNKLANIWYKQESNLKEKSVSWGYWRLTNLFHMFYEWWRKVRKGIPLEYTKKYSHLLLCSECFQTFNVKWNN